MLKRRTRKRFRGRVRPGIEGVREIFSSRAWYQCGLLGILILLVLFLIMGIVLSFSVQPTPGSQVFLTPAPPETFTTVEGNETTMDTTAVTGTSTEITTTSLPTTTVPPTTTVLVPITLECPQDISWPLGKEILPLMTGNASVSGGCVAPIISYQDVVNGTIAKKKDNVVMEPKVSLSGGQGTPYKAICSVNHIPVPANISISFGSNEYRKMEVKKILAKGPRPGSQRGENGNVNKKKLFQSRTPSFSANPLSSVGNTMIANTGSIPPDPVGAVSLTQSVFAVNEASGTFVAVTDKNQTMLITAFIISLMGTGVCGAPNDGDPQILYDQDADRWILLELQKANNSLCLFVSDTNDATGPYSQTILEFNQTFPDFPKIGLWNRVYTLTINVPANVTNPNPENMCVIDRSSLLAGNVTEIDWFCSAPFNGPLQGFGFNAWTPVTVEGGPLPPQATESSGTPGVGAVFVRHDDDEVHGDPSPAMSLDYIEVEHWTNINITGASYQNVRYRVPVSEFDSSSGTCTASNECVPTPVSQELDPVREVVMHRAVYRYLPNCNNQESLLVTLTSHANGVDNARIKWHELRFQRPSPSISPLFTNYQEGYINPDAAHRWLPSPAMDGNGTIVIGYAKSSASIWPSMFASARFASDPLGMMRQEFEVASGSVGNLTSARWGDYFSMSSDPSSHRNFYFAGQVSDATYPWVARMHYLRVAGEVVERTFTAEDECDQIETCTQIIRLE